MAFHSRKLWGEIEENNSNSNSHNAYVPDITADIERSMNKFCLAEFDTDYDEDSSSEEHIEYINSYGVIK